MKTVREVSRITGVSVRTLHHYDAIGLLKPTAVTEAGYRLYDDAALKRMQSSAAVASTSWLTDAAYPLRVHTVFLHFRNFELGQKFWLRLLAELCGVALTCSGHCLYQQIPLLQLTFYGRKECPGCRGRSGRRRCSRPGFRKPYGSGRRWTRLPLRLRGTRR